MGIFVDKHNNNQKKIRNSMSHDQSDDFIVSKISRINTFRSGMSSRQQTFKDAKGQPMQFDSLLKSGSVAIPQRASLLEEKQGYL